MSAHPPTDAAGCRPPSPRAFTLVELLVVMAVAVVLLTLVAPAFTQVNTGRQITLAAYSIEGLLDTARAYAKANDTYTWVGFYEENGSRGSTTPATVGSGRVIVSVVASKDGTAIGTAPLDSDSTRLTQLNKLVKLDNTHLSELAASDVVTRTTVPASAYQVGSDSFSQAIKFHYPLGATDTAAAYTFIKIIRFDPTGDAIKMSDSPVRLMEIGLRPAHGAIPDATTRSCAAIQVTGITGAVRIYQP